MLEAEKLLPEEYKEKITFYRYNLDNNRGLINYLNVWPIPHVFYFPFKWKESDSLVGYDQKIRAEIMVEWLKSQIDLDEKSNFKTLTPNKL